MSSLMVSNDLDIMMIEFAVQKLFLPKTSVFDTVIMKKITVMFRMLDSDWTSVNPQRADYVPYRGSCDEETDFRGGKSVVFAIPTGSLNMRIQDVDIQIHVIKEVAKYFEVTPNIMRQNVGVAFANVDRLFNGIIKDLREREELKDYLNCFHKRQPISRSLKETYEIVDEDHRKTGATIGIYVRLSYFGKSVITEIERDRGLWREFYAQEETNETSPYQCRELLRSDLESGCWGSGEYLGPLRANQLKCSCDKWSVVEEETDERVDGKTDGEKSRDTGEVGLGGGGGRGGGGGGGGGRGQGGQVTEGRKTGKGTGKGKRGDKESVEGVEKRGRKSSGDHSQVRRIGKVNKPEKGEMEKSTRMTKSADGEKVRRKTYNKTDIGKGFPSRLSKTLETSESEVLTGRQKLRSNSGEKRIREDLRDRKTIRKLDKPEVTSVKPTKHKKTDSRESKASTEYTKLLEQLRKRRRGIVTVGIEEKKTRVCQNETVACTKQPDFISSQFCHDVQFTPQLCHYPRSYPCNPPSTTINNRCFAYSANKRHDFCPNFRHNAPEMQIVTN